MVNVLQIIIVLLSINVAICPVGDQEGAVKNGLTCSELVKADPSQCTDSKLRYRCCASCNLHKSKYIQKDNETKIMS